MRAGAVGMRADRLRTRQQCAVNRRVFKDEQGVEQRGATRHVSQRLDLSQGQVFVFAQRGIAGLHRAQPLRHADRAVRPRHVDA
ncbi:hypothetical protein D3C78_1868250 [compost metagenome]